MKIVFLNLPNESQVIRRYMCSYNAPNFLFPPLELMSLASVVKSCDKTQVWILDAIAKRLKIKQVKTLLYKINPDMVVFLSGFEIFQEDMQAADYLKKVFPQTKFVVFGYLPTIFPDKILTETGLDFCIMNEPEVTFLELCRRLAQGTNCDGIEGLGFKKNAKVKLNPPRPRIEDLDSLPYPARDLVDNNLYGEPFMMRPFTLIQSARGCPFNCTYCVKSFGKKLICRSAENIISEIEECVKVYGIRNFRFIDDTFNVNSQRVKQICRMMLERNLKVEWTALSRADTLREDDLKLMKESGCRRLYIGIESGSQRILDFYKKGYKVDKIKQAVRIVNVVGIESVGFFMVGTPEENEQDSRRSIQLAKELDLDYIVVFRTIAYPGTPLFDLRKNQIEFSLFPYINRLKDKRLDGRYSRWERRFYRQYYLRFGFIGKRLRKFLQNPFQSLKGLFCIIRYVLAATHKRPRPDLI